MTRPLPPAPGNIQAKVLKRGCGLNPVTCEVVTACGQQLTIWLNGHHVGDVVALERRMSSSGPYWCEVGYAK
jgi:hypothetical protein